MSYQYKVFKNNGSGGPVDYTTAIATVTSGTYTPSALALNSDTTFAVRTYDPASGLDDGNRDVRTRIIVDGSGADVTKRPGPVTGVVARPVVGGLRVAWGHNPVAGGRATGFKIWASTSAIDYTSTPSLTVAARDGMHSYSAVISGLSTGNYNVAVRAYNAVAAEPNTATATAAVSASGPSPVEGLTAATTDSL